LRQRAAGVAQRALHSGALQPIATHVHHVTQAGVRFVVRRLAGAAGQSAVASRLARATAGESPAANPFLPYDPALFVADLSSAHLCLLNKFPVVDQHLLIVTRAFALQEEVLNVADFAVLLACMRQIDGLAFYNAGKIAGASQRHKHLQLAPFPLDPAGVDAPILPALGEAAPIGAVVRAAALPFRHALLWLPPAAGASFFAEAYRALLAAIGVWAGEEAPPRPYNWLATRRWMLAAPRTAEAVEGMAVNGLGFAGSLLVRSLDQLAWLERTGPLSALCAVSEPADRA
jgi:ATP adenylyltransferase